MPDRADGRVASGALVPFAADASAANATKPAAIQVMILGSHRMGNPGLDQVSVEMDNVTLPIRRNALAAPSELAVEMVPRLDAFAISECEKFTQYT